MFAQHRRLTGRHRRGVVLVLILAMLGLLAVIGVTFATFSGQSQVGSRYFAQGLAQPDTEQVMDFALAQLINDTDNPASAIRGHSQQRERPQRSLRLREEAKTPELGIRSKRVSACRVADERASAATTS